MPVYNVGNYLDKAISSILLQSMSDFELILVNDGSTDNSKDICEKYKLEDDRIILINQENQGAHIARNNGIKISRGDYLCFFDSDDYVETDMLLDLYNIAIKYNSDLVVCGFNINTYYKDDRYTVQRYIPYTSNNASIESFNNESDFRKLAYHNFDRNMFYPPWNKLYKAEYILQNEIRFPITYRDDFPFVLGVIKDIKNITYVKKPYYNFLRKRSESETQKYVSTLYDKREEEHNEMLMLYKYWQLDTDEQSREMISRRYIDRIIECMVNLFNKDCKLSDAEKNHNIKNYMSTTNYDIAIKYAKPKKAYLKIMYIPLKLKNVTLSFTMSKFINYVKCHNVKLFTNLKTYR